MDECCIYLLVKTLACKSTTKSGSSDQARLSRLLGSRRMCTRHLYIDFLPLCLSLRATYDSLQQIGPPCAGRKKENNCFAYGRHVVARLLQRVKYTGRETPPDCFLYWTDKRAKERESDDGGGGDGERKRKRRKAFFFFCFVFLSVWHP